MVKAIAKQHTKLRFIIVGIWNTIFSYLVFFGFDTLFATIFYRRYVAYMSAMILSSIISIINAYIFHKYITFRSQVRGKGIIIEFIRFFSTYIASIILVLIILPICVEMFHLNPKIAAAITIPISTIISYLGHSRFSFKI